MALITHTLVSILFTYLSLFRLNLWIWSKPELKSSKREKFIMGFSGRKDSTASTFITRLSQLEVGSENSTLLLTPISSELLLTQLQEWVDSYTSTIGSTLTLEERQELTSMPWQVLLEVWPEESSLIHLKLFSQECKSMRCTLNNIEETIRTLPMESLR